MTAPAEPEQRYIVTAAQLKHFEITKEELEAGCNFGDRLIALKEIRQHPYPPKMPSGISNIEFAKGLAECLGNESEEHEECNICPLRSKCIDLNLLNARTTKDIPAQQRIADAILKEIDRILAEHPARIVNHLFIAELKERIALLRENRP